MTDNSFIREVDEAVRQERYKALWDKFGIYIIVLVLALIIGTIAYNVWKYLEESAAKTAGDAFTAALVLESGNDQADADKTFEELAEDGPSGYSVLSRFQLASSQAKAGETDKAVEAYEGLANDRRVDNILKGLATLQAAKLRIDEADYAEMQERLDGLAMGTSAWRFSAKELLGLSAYQNDDLEAAEEQFSSLLVDAGTPRNMRERANVMLALIVSQTAAGPEAGAQDAKPDDTTTDDAKTDDTTTDDTQADDAKPDDAEAEESQTEDSGADNTEAGGADADNAAAEDTGPEDANAEDANAEDAEANEAATN